MKAGRSHSGWDSSLLHGSVLGSWGEWLLNTAMEDSQCQTVQRRRSPPHQCIPYCFSEAGWPLGFPRKNSRVVGSLISPRTVAACMLRACFLGLPLLIIILVIYYQAGNIFWGLSQEAGMREHKGRRERRKSQYEGTLLRRLL